MGLPCFHDFQFGPIPLEFIHPFWHYSTGHNNPALAVPTLESDNVQLLHDIENAL
jgi:hypothetical protein